MISLPSDFQARSLVTTYDQKKSVVVGDTANLKAIKETFEDALAKVWKRPSPVELDAGVSVLLAHFEHRDHAISTRPVQEHERIEAGLHFAVNRILHLS
ncbi:MAG: hypothetical protein ABIV50_15845 [Opitutus sp.]